MACYDNEMTKEEFDEEYDGKCSLCENAVNSEKESIELDNCQYSEEICSECGYRPCDLSC